jgi:hypothetical protein
MLRRNGHHLFVVEKEWFDLSILPFVIVYCSYSLLTNERLMNQSNYVIYPLCLARVVV